MKNKKYKYVCIGIDQSYANTGISISADGVLKKVTSVELYSFGTNYEKRTVLRSTLSDVVECMVRQASNVVCVIERIRLMSKGFLNINYIKSIGALNALIADVMAEYGVKTYSVDTRCWKAQVVGTSKPEKNEYNVPEEKWPTIKWVERQGFKSKIINKVDGKKTKGTFIGSDGIKYMYNNDAADSAAISMFWFKVDKKKLEEER